MTHHTHACDRCGKEVPHDAVKELAYEVGPKAERKTEMVCAECLDRAMNEADEVRGIAGTHKNAAAHLSGGGGASERQSPSKRG